jgi:hypothetical protein
VSINYYDIYIDNTLSLAETIVIKSEQTADVLNNLIQAIHGADAVDLTNPLTWKYYLNISGQYHPTDRVISVTSFDTLQTITFSRSNLSFHKATREAYKYGTRQYTELVSLYPDLEMLILGILYPADISKAISAKDGAILAYGEGLVEDNEVSLIEKLNDWITSFKIRWHNHQFNLSDTLYETAHLGLIYLNLVPAILNIRLMACRTAEAHSFHIREYLASHNGLDVYLPLMTKKQALFFYRNIAYIERHAGTQDTFNWLIQNVMTERNLPLGEYKMFHNVSVMPESLNPEIEFIKKAINSVPNTQERIKYTLNDLLHKESLLSTGNAEYITENSEKINTKLKESLSSVVITKSLESSVIDYSDASPFTLEEISLSHWLSLGVSGKYTAIIDFKNPRTGELMTLKAIDAYAYFVYCYFKSLGVSLSIMPEFLALRTLRDPIPTVIDILSVGDTQYVTDYDAKIILSTRPTLNGVFSTIAFKELCSSIYSGSIAQVRYILLSNHQYRTALLENMVNRLYTDSIYRLMPEGGIYSVWLSDKNLPDTAFTTDEYTVLYNELYESATGIKLIATGDLENLQKAMVAIMSKLSSYSIQYLQEINTLPLKVLNNKPMAIGDIKTSLDSDIVLPCANSYLYGMKSTLATRLHHEIKYPEFTLNQALYNTLPIHSEILVTPYLEVNSTFGLTEHFNFSGVTVETSINGSVETGLFPSGYEYYTNLANYTTEGLKDIYCDCFPSDTGISSDLSNILLINHLGSFVSLGLSNNKLPGFKVMNLANSSTQFSPSVSVTVVIDGFIANTKTAILNAFVLNTNVTVDSFLLSSDVVLTSFINNTTASNITIDAPTVI